MHRFWKLRNSPGKFKGRNVNFFRNDFHWGRDPAAEEPAMDKRVVILEDPQVETVFGNLV